MARPLASIKSRSNEAATLKAEGNWVMKSVILGPAAVYHGRQIFVFVYPRDSRGRTAGSMEETFGSSFMTYGHR